MVRVSLATDHPPRLGATHVEVLESLNHHRMLSTRQIHFLHTPDASRRWTRAVLSRLRRVGLVEMVRAPGGEGLWYLTERGADAMEVIPSRSESRRKTYRYDQAIGSLQQHTLGVNDVGLAFVRAARERGDECEAFAWRHEIAHSLGPPPGKRVPEQLIADAVLSYQLNRPDGTPDSFLYRFIELDRATRAANDLAERLARYGRLYHRTIPADKRGRLPERLWPKLYPVFPGVLVVLANGTRERLERRRDVVLRLCAQEPDVRDTPEVDIAICLLADLFEHGPFAPICRTIADPDAPVDWTGTTNES
jgi:hypothetical protein